MSADQGGGVPAARVEVYFRGVLAGCSNLVVLPLLLVVLLLPDSGIRVLLGTLAAVAVTYSLFLIGSTLFDRKPMLVLMREGILLPIAGDIFLPYERVEVWAEMPQLRSDGDGRYWIFSLQGRPRIRLDLPWWARFRLVRQNTLLNGDLCFDERYISIDARQLVREIELRRAARDNGNTP